MMEEQNRTAEQKRRARARARKKRQKQKNAICIILIVIAIILVCALVLPYVLAKPKVTLTGEQTLKVAVGETYKDAGATAIFRGKDITNELKETTDVDTKKAGTYSVTYTISYHNKEFSQTRSIEVTDQTSPVLTLQGADEVKLVVGDTFTDPGCKAEDNCDGDLSDQVKSDGIVDTKKAGSYTLTYSVTDAAGNEGKATRTVTVAKEKHNPDHAVYLTFDDGPSPDVTVEVLDTLKKNNIQATFFIVDYSDENKHLIQRMIDEGHTIGIHGYSHEYDKIYASDDAFMENINKLHDKVLKDFGYDAYVLRFPGGSSNTVSRHYSDGIMTRLVERVKSEGWEYLDWNVSSGDAAGNNVPSDQIIANCKREMSTAQSNVILMHDTSAKQTTANALQSIIDYGKSNGYSFYPFAQDSVPVHHGVNN